MCGLCDENSGGFELSKVGAFSSSSSQVKVWCVILTWRAMTLGGLVTPTDSGPLHKPQVLCCRRILSYTQKAVLKLCWWLCELNKGQGRGSLLDLGMKFGGFFFGRKVWGFVSSLAPFLLMFTRNQPHLPYHTIIYTHEESISRNCPIYSMFL